MQHVDEGRLHAWLDGELPDEERALERHLEECGACRARADEERRIRGAASSILLGADPGEIAMRRMVAVPAARRPRPWVAVGWAASVLLALGVGWMARPSPRDPVAIAPAPASTQTEADLGPAAAPVQPAEPASDAAPVETSARPAPATPEGAARPAPAAKTAARPREQSDPAPVPEAPAVVAERIPELPPPAEPAPPVGTYALEVPPAGPPPVFSPPAPASPPPVASRRAEAAEAASAPALPPPPVERVAETVTLRGRIVAAETGQALAGVQVSVPALAARTVTRADGSYDLTIPAERLAGSETIQVQASVIGRAAQSRVIAAESGTANFAMPGSAIGLEGVVAVARAGESWRAAARAEAERHLRHPLVIVPGLRVLGIEVGRVEGRNAVRVRQRLPGGETLSLVQRRATARADTTGADVTIRRGRLLVGASAPIPADSIRSLF